MKIARRLVIGVFLTIMVVAISTCGVDWDKAKAVKTINTTAPVDLSGVDWTGLARLMYGKCGEWHDLAIAVGWTEAQWPKLSYVIHRESRCNIGSFNKSDPNGGSRGLMQINGYWCRKNKYNPSGWLQAKGILNNCEDLFNPEVNLRAGLAMWNYSQERNKCGWRPWATRC
jgi:hypothetical protein